MTICLLLRNVYSDHLPALKYLFLCCCVSCFYILGINNLSWMDWKYFSLLHRLFLYSCCFLWCADSQFNKILFVNLFSCCLQIVLPISMSWNISLGFSLQFYSLRPYIWVSDPFWAEFCVWEEALKDDTLCWYWLNHWPFLLHILPWWLIMNLCSEEIYCLRFVLIWAIIN